MDNPLTALQRIGQSLALRGSTEFDTQGVVEIVGVDIDAMLSFYETLGFRIERMAGAFAVVNGYGVRIFLAQDPKAATGMRWTNLRLLVPDAGAIWDCVLALKLPVGNPIGDRPYGLRDFTVADPNGFEIRFAQLLPAAA